MSLTLHYHPLSSCCHKALIALYELGTPFEPRLLNLGDPEQREDFVALWPTGKMPLLQDGPRVIPETSIIIEYLAGTHAQAGQTLIPANPAQALEVRLMDRLLDLYVMTPMQAIVADRLRAEADRDPLSVEKARSTLQMAYGLIEGKLIGRTWLAGEDFTMADCAAAPALFYAFTLVEPAQDHERLIAYFERLIGRPSVARTIDEARPWFQYYPYKDKLPRRFTHPEETR